MANEEEDLIVNLEPEVTEEGEKPVVAKPPPVPGPSVSSQSAVKELERQIEAERADRGRLMAENQRLEREREEAVQVAQRAEQQTGNNYVAWLDSQISNMTNEMDTMAAQAEACRRWDFNRRRAQQAHWSCWRAALARAGKTRSARPSSPSSPSNASSSSQAAAVSSGRSD
jgi:hypothetical protein